MSLYLSHWELPQPEYSSTKSMIQELLSIYSLGQCACFFKHSSQCAAEFKMGSDISAQHASNFVIQKCRELAEKSKNNDITIETLNRNEYAQRSMISIVTDEIMLGAGDRPFHERIPFEKDAVIELTRNDLEPKKLSVV